MLPVYKLALIFGLLFVVGIAAWLVVRRIRPGLRGAGAVAALSFVLLTGAPGMVQDAYLWVSQSNQHVYQERVRPEAAAAVAWLRSHSSPDDIVATNQHFLEGTRSPLSFWLSALSGRRELIGSWSYAPRANAEATRVRTSPVGVPFWDPELLAANDIVFTDPSAERVDRLRRLGVRWLVVNRAVGVESPALGAYALLRFDRGTVAIYQVPAGPPSPM
jgi:hypothetical protein